MLIIYMDIHEIKTDLRSEQKYKKTLNDIFYCRKNNKFIRIFV